MAQIKGFNPFLNSKGELVNKFLNYEKVLDNPNVSQRARAYISQVTGLTPTATSGGRDLIGGNSANTGAVSAMPQRMQRTATPTPMRMQRTATPIRGMTGSSGNALVDTAKKYLGTQYVWGGASPKGFDCSGLMQYTFKQNGISIPRTAREQFKSGTAISQSDLAPGDLVFFKGSRGSATAPGHVGMYIGNGQYIQAPKTGDVVKISNLSGRKDYVGARRYS